MKKVFASTVLMTCCLLAFAKLPPLDDAAKAKAAETAAKAGWQGKADAYLLCKAQDKVAVHYRKTLGDAPAKEAQAVPVPGTAVATVAAAPAVAAVPTATPPAAIPLVAAQPAVPGGTAAMAAGAPTPTPCADPGPFAYSPPEQKPLEASGAHSPAGNATSPPSVSAPSAEMAPARK